MSQVNYQVYLVGWNFGYYIEMTKKMNDERKDKHNRKFNGIEKDLVVGFFETSKFLPLLEIQIKFTKSSKCWQIKHL